MRRLEGKTAVITGAATGIGAAVACLFAREGAKILVADIKAGEAEQTVRQIKKNKGEAVFVRTDVAKIDDLENMIERTVDLYGKLDIFFHNAAVAGPGFIDATTEEDYDRVMAVNLKAGFFGAKFAASKMRRTGGGCMLFTSSRAGLKPSPNSAAYSISKAGIIMLTRTLAAYLAKDNIRVNCICPGPVETELFAIAMSRNPETDPDEARRKMLEVRPMQRYGTPEEMAEGALFLASEAASYITGVALPIDGGGAAV